LQSLIHEPTLPGMTSIGPRTRIARHAAVRNRCAQAGFKQRRPARFAPARGLTTPHAGGGDGTGCRMTTRPHLCQQPHDAHHRIAHKDIAPGGCASIACLGQITSGRPVDFASVAGGPAVLACAITACRIVLPVSAGRVILEDMSERMSAGPLKPLRV